MASVNIDSRVSHAGSAFPRAVVERELERILQSDPFRESKRCQEFLRFVILTSLDGRDAELKERTIGIAVFARDPSYNTNDDSIVRVKASEVRKRLALYNLIEHTNQQVRIELAPGSYVPEFSKVVTPKPIPATHWRPQARHVWITTALIVLAALLSWVISGRSTSAHERFWQSVVQRPDPVLICMAHPVVYTLSKRLHEEFRAQSGRSVEPGPYVLPLKPGNVDVSDIIPVTDQYVGVGDAQAAVLLSTTLRGYNRPSQMRTGNDVSFSELRNSPAILIGAFSNRWTLQMTNELRFVFEFKDGRKIVLDRSGKGQAWAPPSMPPNGKVSEDYAIVSRVFDTKSGQIVVAVAGITQYGTQAAGEFLANPEHLNRAVAQLPPDWSQKNLQFVIKTNIIGAGTTPPQLLAVHVW